MKSPRITLTVKGKAVFTSAKGNIMYQCEAPDFPGLVYLWSKSEKKDGESVEAFCLDLSVNKELRLAATFWAS